VAEELRITLLMAGAKNRGDLPKIEFFWTKGDKKKWKKFMEFKEVIDELDAWKK
jgi:hypothetical protein